MISPRKRLALTIAAVILAAGPAAVADRLMLAPYREYTRQGSAIDWLTGRSEAGAATTLITQLNKLKKADPKVVMEAEEAARAKLMDLLGGLRVDSTSTLGSMEGVMEEVRARMEEIESVSTPPRRGSKMVVTVQLPLWGDMGIVSLLMPRVDSPDPDSTVTHFAPASSPGAGIDLVAPAGEEEPVTGLVIDATGLTAPAPALFGRILDENGRVIHAIEQADPDAVRANGLMAYAIKLYSGTPMFRNYVKEGARPMLVEAIALGESDTDFIVSPADADRILATDAASPFLKPCQVLVLLPPVGPIPDKTPPPPPKPPVPPKKKADGVHR